MLPFLIMHTNSGAQAKKSLPRIMDSLSAWSQNFIFIDEGISIAVIFYQVYNFLFRQLAELLAKPKR